MGLVMAGRRLALQALMSDMNDSSTSQAMHTVQLLIWAQQVSHHHMLSKWCTWHWIFGWWCAGGRQVANLLLY